MDAWISRPALAGTSGTRGRDHLEIICDVPGATPEDVQITCAGGVLTIHAQRKGGYAEGTVHRAERWSGEFTRLQARRGL